MKNILNKLDWEKKFDNQFGNLYEADHDYRGRNRTKAIKNFIKKIYKKKRQVG